MPDDVLGAAIRDRFFNNTAPSKLWVYDTIGPRVEMDVATYFRDRASMPELEKIALQECRGKVLDIGAGAGSHALELQRMGLDVTALEISPGAVEVMRARGVAKAIAADVFSYDADRYDTLLLLMNGIGLVQTLDGLRRFLQHAKALLRAGGQLLFDSSDVAYLYEEDGERPPDRYYGEIVCRYGYKRRKTAPFSWLYIDYTTLERMAGEEGWAADFLYEDDTEQYLARLTRKQD